MLTALLKVWPWPDFLLLHDRNRTSITSFNLSKFFRMSWSLLLQAVRNYPPPEDCFTKPLSVPSWNCLPLSVFSTDNFSPSLLQPLKHQTWFLARFWVELLSACLIVRLQAVFLIQFWILQVQGLFFLQDSPLIFCFLLKQLSEQQFFL